MRIKFIVCLLSAFIFQGLGIFLICYNCSFGGFFIGVGSGLFSQIGIYIGVSNEHSKIFRRYTKLLRRK